MKNSLTAHFPVMTFLLALISLAGLSCEKVVDIDLNSSDPHIVIEGDINDWIGRWCIVKLTQTVNFDEPNTFPPISGAKITLRDDVGNIDSLTESDPGSYSGSVIQGMPGRTYTLTVVAGGKEYVATSTMPSPVEIDSATVSQIAFGRNVRKGLNVYFQDRPNEKNYYRLVEYHYSVEYNKYVPSKNIFVYEDRLQDGNQITARLFSNEDTLKTGDDLTVSLQCIDKGAYDYFRTMRLASGGGGPQAASPANPVSNFSNGALGYFSAHTNRSSGPIMIP